MVKLSEIYDRTWFCLPASNNPIYLIVLSYQLTLVY